MTVIYWAFICLMWYLILIPCRDTFRMAKKLGQKVRYFYFPALGSILYFFGMYINYHRGNPIGILITLVGGMMFSYFVENNQEALRRFIHGN